MSATSGARKTKNQVYDIAKVLHEKQTASEESSAMIAAINRSQAKRHRRYSHALSAKHWHSLNSRSTESGGVQANLAQHQECVWRNQVS
jgi:uncharacterized protein YceH (UPF0502 family)